jgi:hypothetical protein
MTNPGGAAPRESNEMKRVSDQIAGRLASRNVRLSGHERPEELAQLEEAVERFEVAVEARWARYPSPTIHTSHCRTEPTTSPCPFTSSASRAPQTRSSTTRDAQDRKLAVP